MATLTPNPVPSSLFTFTTDDGVQMLVSELSTVGRLGRVYDDACDVGLTVVSQRTGRKVVYSVQREHRDAREGELLWLDLTPANPAERNLPLVRLFND